MCRLTALFAMLVLTVGSALAQQRTESPAVQPLPAVPPPPPEMAPFDAALEPEVTIRKRDGETV
ncbi:MAG TPA: DUF2782 domain-containing protein, partial [Accumulibacter sp.]|nr:DUF2782 domain-containing protein [Accumulibacter sp.]